MGPSSRLMQLDIFRCLAIFLVIGAHLPGFEVVLPKAIQVHVIAYWTRFGWIGVDLFFVLSGFLISGLLFREYQSYGRIRLGRFLTRRAFRIYPPFWFLLAFTVWVQVTNHTYHTYRANNIMLLHDFFFVMNYFPGLMFYYWSLAVEEHFYILLPIILLIACKYGAHGKNPFRWLPLVSLGLLILALVLRILEAPDVGWFHPYKNYTPTHLRFDSILFGVVISYYYHFHHVKFIGWVRRLWWLLIIAGFGFIIPECCYDLGPVPFVYTWGMTCLYLGFGSLISASLVCPMPKAGILYYIVRPFSFIGAHSYSIYLWHLPMKMWGPMYSHKWFHLKQTPDRDLFIYLVGSIVVGIALSMAIEFPSRVIRDRFFPTRSTTLVSTLEKDGIGHLEDGEVKGSMATVNEPAAPNASLPETGR